MADPNVHCLAACKKNNYANPCITCKLIMEKFAGYIVISSCGSFEPKAAEHTPF